MFKYFLSLKVFFWSYPPCYFQHQPLQRGVILPISVSSNHKMNLSSVPQHLSKTCLPHLHLCKHLNPLAGPSPSLLNFQQTSPTWFSSHPSDYFLRSSVNMRSPELCPQPSWHSPVCLICPHGFDSCSDADSLSLAIPPPQVPAYTCYYLMKHLPMQPIDTPS